MREPEPEVPLPGGHMTEVVRVGDTVRRTAGRWTPTIHALLRHVRAAGFTLAPEPLGIDQRGREILTFLPGVADGAPEVVHATRRSTPSRGCAAYRFVPLSSPENPDVPCPGAGRAGAPPRATVRGLGRRSRDRAARRARHRDRPAARPQRIHAPRGRGGATARSGRSSSAAAGGSTTSTRRTSRAQPAASPVADDARHGPRSRRQGGARHGCGVGHRAGDRGTARRDGRAARRLGHRRRGRGRGAGAARHGRGGALLAAGGGAIVNVSSTLDLRGAPNASPYSASQHGVIGLTRTAAIEYAPHGIRVNAVCPGAIDTPMMDETFARFPGFREMLVGFVPMGRMGTPAEVAAAIAWLLSDAAAFVTGEALTVEGGLLSR